VNFARASLAAAATASALALIAPAAGAQVPSVELPPLPDVPGINAAAPNSAISGQYHEIAAAVEKALPPVPAATPAPAPSAARPPAPKPAPEYHPKAPQYHSETPPDVSVTQTQPTNVNVSIRINSPGDDGPVVQVNGAGADVVTNVVNHITDAPDPAPAPADSGVSGLPDDWTWIWTSACFGGGGGAPAGAAAATGGPHWDWQWSCDQDVPAGVLMPGPDSFPSLGPISDPVAAALPPPLANAFDLGQPDRPKPRAAPRHHARAPDTAAARGSAAPPAQGSGGGLLTGAPQLAVRSVAAAAAHVGAAARHAAEARARPARSDDDLNTFPSGAGGLAASAASGSTAAMSLLLVGWTAVLVCALALAIPQIWRRRWSGPPSRKPAPRAMRLERPG